MPIQIVNSDLVAALIPEVLVGFDLTLDAEGARACVDDGVFDGGGRVSNEAEVFDKHLRFGVSGNPAEPHRDRPELAVACATSMVADAPTASGAGDFAERDEDVFPAREVDRHDIVFAAGADLDDQECPAAIAGDRESHAARVLGIAFEGETREVLALEMLDRRGRWLRCSAGLNWLCFHCVVERHLEGRPNIGKDILAEILDLRGLRLHH